MLDIYPDRIAYFDKKYPAKTFILLIARDAQDEFVLHNSKYYHDSKIVFCEPNQSIQKILNKEIPANADIFFLHYKYNKPFDLESLDIAPSQRFIEMADRKSTPITPEIIKYFLDIIYRTDPNEFIRKVDNFFETFNGYSNIEYFDKQYNTSAIVNMNTDSLWSEVFGVIKPGERGLIPAGELVLTHDDFTHKSVKALDMNGEITLHGIAILQANKFDDDIFKYQNKLFNRLAKLKNHPVIATIQHGKIIKLQECNKGSEIPLLALEKMFEIDERYRTIFELGIGLNSSVKMTSGNCSMNETYGGSNMCVHFGIGSLFADHEFHLDIICPSTEIRAENRILNPPITF